MHLRFNIDDCVGSSRYAWLTMLILLVSAPAWAQENWPSWRGPTADGIAPAAAKPPLTWSETANIKWKVKIAGRGSASPIVWGNRVFVQTAVPASGTSEPSADEVHKFIIQCLDRQTGKLLWEKTAREEKPHEAYHPSDGTFASNSCVTDGEHVWAYFGSRGVYCYDMDGNLKWNKDLGDMKIKLAFGEGTSPVLHGEHLVILWDQEGDSFITALNKSTGEQIWKTPRAEATTWTTPLIVEHAGQQQVIVSATSKIRSYELKTGKLIWECGGMTRNVIPVPVVSNGIVYCTSGYSGNSVMAIKLGRTGDLTGTDAVVWKYARNTPYVPSPVLAKDRLYLFAGNTPVLTSFDAMTGKVMIDGKRIEGLNGVYASPVAADGRIYIVGRNGTSAVIKQSDTLEVLATNKLDDKIDASPAIVDRQIFLRGLEHVYCIEEKTTP